MLPFGMGPWGKRAAGLAKQFNIPREGMGSGIGPDSVFALKQIVHRDWRLLSPTYSEMYLLGQFAFSCDKHNGKTLLMENLSWHVLQTSNNMAIHGVTKLV